MCRHPFDASCVEADMVAKVFGPIWNLAEDRACQTWLRLLCEAGLHVPQLDWQKARVQFSPYPPHHGGEGTEIGDIVLLEPSSINVVFEAKRPFVSIDQEEEAKKAQRAACLAKRLGWPAPKMVLIASGEQVPDCFDSCLTWSSVACVFEECRQGGSTASFIRHQLNVQQDKQSANSFARFGLASTTLDRVFSGRVLELAKLIIKRRDFEPKAQKNRGNSYVDLSLNRRAHAQLHEYNGGVAIAVREADERCPRCEALERVRIEALSGYYGSNKSWLEGNGKRYTHRPAVAFLVPEELTDNQNHPGWRDVDELLNYARE